MMIIRGQIQLSIIKIEFRSLTWKVGISRANWVWCSQGPLKLKGVIHLFWATRCLPSVDERELLPVIKVRVRVRVWWPSEPSLLLASVSPWEIQEEWEHECICCTGIWQPLFYLTCNTHGIRDAANLGMADISVLCQMNERVSLVI